MYNVQWIKIICMAIQLFSQSEFKNQTSVVITWIPADSLDLIAPEPLPAVSIQFQMSDSKTLISEYVLIPRQNLYQKKTAGEKQFVNLDKSFVTVTPHAVVFRKVLNSVLPDTLKFIAAKYEELFNQLMQTDSNQSIIRQEHGFSTDNGLRVIQMKEYPNYIDLEVAQSGTKLVQKIIPHHFPKNKMIRLTMIPEYGPAHTQWIEQPYHFGDSCIAFSEKTAIAVIDSGFSNAVKNIDHYSKNKVCSFCQDQIECAVMSAGCDVSAITHHWKTVVRRLLLIEKDFDPYEDIHRVYPGYEPKLSADSMLDYMGELSVDISQLPETAADKLPELVKLYDQYRKKAKKNPGKWNDGNMILGANDKEYDPSRDELILNEIGNRIKNIIESVKKEEIERIMKVNNIKKKTIRYKHFTFRHSDIIGSGRFTYVNN